MPKPVPELCQNVGRSLGLKRCPGYRAQQCRLVENVKKHHYRTRNNELGILTEESARDPSVVYERCLDLIGSKKQGLIYKSH